MSMVTDALRLASQLRVPVFARNAAPPEKSDALEEFTLVSAFHAGNLHAERLAAHEQLRDLTSEWEHLEGWEPFRRSKTEAAVDDAKRQLRPDLYDAIRDARWTIARLGEEIDRLERDAQKCSRAYTMIAGS